MDIFSDSFRSELTQLMLWRRDVRHFRRDPIEEELLLQCLNTFHYAPSVGLSEPWRIIRVRSEDARQKVTDNFQASNSEALKGYDGEKAKSYAGLKLSGLAEAPEHLAIFCDESTVKGAGLGAKTMPETRRYSVVGAINLMWLFARSHGLGMGWVSILDADRLAQDLEVPTEWSLVAYLCMGWPEAYSKTPELETVGWENRADELFIKSR